MGALRQRIVNDETVRHGEYRKNKLECLLADVIARTTFRDKVFKCMYGGYTDSSSKRPANKIMISAYDAENMRIPVRIQLAECHEIWTMHISLAPEMRPQQAGLRKELKKAAAAIYKEEEKKHKERLHAQGDVGHDAQDPADIVQPGKKRRIRVANVISTEMIAKIMQEWLRQTGGERKSLKRDFISFLPSVLVENEINRQCVVSFLEKRGFLTEIPEVRRPLIEITNQTMTFLDVYRQECEAREKDAHKEQLRQELQQFPARMMHLLERNIALYQFHHELSRFSVDRHALQEQIAEDRKKISELERGIKVAEEKILDLDRREKEIDGESKKIVSTFGEIDLEALMAISQKAALLS